MPGVFDAGENDARGLMLAKAVFGIVLALAAPFVAYATTRTFLKASRSNSWPQAEATVTRSEVTTDFPVGARGPQFDPKVDYRFAAGGKPYVGNTIAFRGVVSASKPEADAVAAKYTVGTRHPVYYDPADPAASVLERGAHWLTYAGLVIPVVMLIVGVLLAREQVAGLRRRPARLGSSRQQYE